MEKKKMITVTIDGAEYAYPYGTPYKNIAADFQDRFSCDILLVNRDGKLCELHKVLDRDCSLKMVTAQAKPGMQTYERSALFLMLKAFYDVAGRENVERITAEYSISNALFILARGNFILDQALLERVEKRMRELAAQALPIEKHSVSTDDAIDLFHRSGLVHKAQLPATSNALDWSCLKTVLCCACRHGAPPANWENSGPPESSSAPSPILPSSLRR